MAHLGLRLVCFEDWLWGWIWGGCEIEDVIVGGAAMETCVHVLC